MQVLGRFAPSDSRNRLAKIREKGQKFRVSVCSMLLHDVSRKFLS